MFDTSTKTHAVNFSIPELHANIIVEKSFHVVDDTLIQRSKMIIGCDLITSLGLEVKGNDLSIKWDDAAIPWRNIDSTKDDLFLAEAFQSDEPVEQEIQCRTNILDTKYVKADLKRS